MAKLPAVLTVTSQKTNPSHRQLLTVTHAGCNTLQSNELNLIPVYSS